MEVVVSILGDMSKCGICDAVLIGKGFNFVCNIVDILLTENRYLYIRFDRESNFPSKIYLIPDSHLHDGKDGGSHGEIVGRQVGGHGCSCWFDNRDGRLEFRRPYFYVHCSQ